MEKVFITGGAGYLGRALVHRLIDHPDHPSITIYSRDEEKLGKLKRQYPQPEVSTIVGDVTDAHHLIMQMQGHDTVIHCAAMKFIPECEKQPSEAIRVNLLGSQMVAAGAAALAEVKHVVGISTDKVCQPINTYGATKMLMERMWMEYSRWSDADFHLVRYGNVMASTGSVVGIWRKQIEAGLQISITSPLMTRFWFSVDDAVDLVLRSLEEPGGTVLVPRLPASMLIDLAEACWNVFGEATRGPWNGDEHLKVIGNRGGEKHYETLITQFEAGKCQPLGVMKEGGPQLVRLYDGDHHLMDYTSGHPDHWLTVDELVAMIRGAMAWET